MRRRTPPPPKTATGPDGLPVALEAIDRESLRLAQAGGASSLWEPHDWERWRSGQIWRMAARRLIRAKMLADGATHREATLGVSRLLGPLQLGKD